MTAVAPLPWHTIRVGLIWAYDGKARPGNDSFCDRALYLTSWLVLKGSARVTHGGRTTEAREGEWLFPSPIPRYQTFAPDTRLLSLAAQVEWPDGRSLFESAESFTLCSAEYPTLARRARQLCRRYQVRHDSFTRHLAYQEALYGWVRLLSETFQGLGIAPRLPAHSGSRLRDLLTLLITCPLDEPHPGERLARELGVSRVQFERLCVATLHRTSRQYLEERRLDHARRTLPLKLAKEVAAEIGFRHVSTFSAWYKRKTGNAPTLEA